MRDKSYGIIPFKRQNSELHFLLIQHQTKEGKGTHWSFPKGHRENREDPETTARRELKEETGIENIRIYNSPVFKEKYSFKTEDAVVNKTVIFFLAEVLTDKVKLPEEEVHDYQWLSYKQAMRKITYEESRQILEKAYNYLYKH